MEFHPVTLEKAWKHYLDTREMLKCSSESHNEIYFTVGSSLKPAEQVFKLTRTLKLWRKIHPHGTVIISLLK